MPSAAVPTALAWAGDIGARSAAELGDELVALFERVAPLADKVQWVHRHICASLGGALDPALERACAAVAEAIDADALACDRPPYHNRQHFCEVALTVRVLCLLDRADVAATQFIVLAALIHDLVHDGGVHGAFRQERASVARARPLLEAAGLDASRIARIAALVLATETSVGTGFMLAACKAHGRLGAVPAVPEAGPELGALIADAQLASWARLLCEADILPSIGLSFAHAVRLQQRLSCEWGRSLDVRDKLAFIDGVLACGILGDFFLPNVRATRQAMIDLPHACAPN